MNHNFQYFRRVLNKKLLTRTNKKYLIRFAEVEIEEWNKFINDLKTTPPSLKIMSNKEVYGTK